MNLTLEEWKKILMALTICYRDRYDGKKYDLNSTQNEKVREFWIQENAILDEYESLMPKIQNEITRIENALWEGER